MAIIFQTRFQNSLDIDFPASAPHPPPNPFGGYNRILGRGIDFGYALTCGSASLVRQLAPYLGTPIHTLTSRIQWGLAGNLYDGATSIPGIPGLSILTWYDPIDANSSNGAAFNTWLLARADGAISLWISGGLTSGADLLVTSAPGVLIHDGRMHGIQVSLSISDHTSVTYNIVINNVSVLSGTATANTLIGAIGGGGCPALHTWAVTDGITLCLERASTTEIVVKGSKQPPGGTYHWQTSIAEVQLDDTINIISYPPCNAVNAVETNQCTPIIPPPPDISGIYMIRESPITHDKYYHDVEKKIPDPTIKTAVLGD